MQVEYNSFTIGSLARTAGVNVETIRYYQRRGLMTEPPRPHGGIRRYGERDLARLRFIKTAQWLGFTLNEIAELLRLENGSHCEEVSRLAEHKLEEVRRKQAELRRMESTLDGLVQACHERSGSMSCPMIESLQNHAGRI